MKSSFRALFASALLPLAAPAAPATVTLLNVVSRDVTRGLSQDYNAALSVQKVHFADGNVFDQIHQP